MRLAGLAIFGSLLINTAFGVVVAGAVGDGRPVVTAALHQCSRHTAPASVHRPADAHYLAAVRLGWTVG